MYGQSRQGLDTVQTDSGKGLEYIYICIHVIQHIMSYKATTTKRADAPGMFNMKLSRPSVDLWSCKVI